MSEGTRRMMGRRMILGRRRDYRRGRRRKRRRRREGRTIQNTEVQFIKLQGRRCGTGRPPTNMRYI